MSANNKKIVEEKSAIERLVKSDDGALLIRYLGRICLNNLGVPCSNAYEYAYNEGRRSVFLTLLQMSEKDLSMFIYDLVKDEEKDI